MFWSYWENCVLIYWYLVTRKKDYVSIQLINNLLSITEICNKINSFFECVEEIKSSYIWDGIY
jgi:hypothetical protein